MLKAEMKGKVPEVKGMEDVLTSNVFGLLRYIQNRNILLKILNKARTLSGKSLNECIGFELSGYSPEFLFWEQVEGFGEPDLMIIFRSPGKPDLILCIEVKYYSSKSGEGDNDQLRRYFEGISESASLSASNFLGIIYLTKHPSRNELYESLVLIKEKGVKDAEERLFQLKWTDVTEVLSEIDFVELSASERMILADLCDYLTYKNLVGFSKFSFASMVFELSVEKFYESSKFSGYSFLKEEFNLDMQVIENER